MFLFFRTPEKEALNGLEREFAALAREFRGKIHSFTLASEVSVAFPLPIDNKMWQTLVQQDLHKLKEKQPDKFKSIITESFNISAEALEQVDVLSIDLGLDDPEPHAIDYFTGFKGLEGYEGFRSQCSRHGMDFQLFYDPLNETQGRIGMVIYTTDNRPLRSALYHFIPSTDVYDHD